MTSIWHPFSALQKEENLPEIVQGEGVFLNLEDGRKVMDCIASWWVNLHGHSEPTIVKAIAKQAQTLEQAIFAGYTHSPAKELVKLLQTKLPSSLSYFFFSDNGSCAVEIALKMAYQYWKNQQIDTRKIYGRLGNAYHGDTVGAMSVGGRSYITKHFEALLQESVYVNPPITWEDDVNREEKEEKALQDLDRLLERHGEEMVAFIVEPLVQGFAGFQMYSPSFLQALQKKLRKYNVLLIFDEVMTGFGRTGKWFALETAGVTPDIMCVAKGITGGFLPLAATICSEQVASVFETPELDKIFYHGHSYTANPLGCAAGIASFHLLEAAESTIASFASWHKEGFAFLADCDKITRFRVCGTLAAMDLQASSSYSLQDRNRIIEAFLNKGFLIRPIGNVLYFVPPYVMTKEQILSLYQATYEVMKEVTF